MLPVLPSILMFQDTQEAYFYGTHTLTQRRLVNISHANISHPWKREKLTIVE